MKLASPFAISARLAPALQVGSAWLSFADGFFVLDLPDGTEHTIRDFNPPRCAVKGVNDTPELMLEDCFRAILSFLSACAESRQYSARRNAGDPMQGDNSDLFPANVGEWAESESDALAMLACELEENRGLISGD